MWTKEKIKDQISKMTPNEVVIQNFSFFSTKVIVSGYGHISRQGQLKSIERQLSHRSSWQVKYDIIPISGAFNKLILNSVFTSIPRLEILSISIDQNANNISIIFQKQPTSLLKTLQSLENSLKVKIYVENQELSSKSSLQEFSTQIENSKSSADNSIQKSDTTDLKTKIESLLPSWFKTTKIILFKDRAEIQTSNDISDIERISFLKLLLESQIGLKIEIKQSYNTDNQIAALSKFLQTSFETFKILIQDKEVNKNTNVIVEYDDFPINEELLQKIKSEAFKKTHLEIIQFISNFEKNSEKICLQLKEWLMNNYPTVEYCFVHFSGSEKKFNILVPETSSTLEEITIDDFNKIIKEEYGFKYPFQVKWIEENPVFYLRERIFIGEQKDLLERIEFNKPVIKIFYEKVNLLPYSIWEKILFRFIKFDVSIIDVVNNQTTGIFDFKDYLLKLDNVKTTDLLNKILTCESEEVEVNSIIFDEMRNKFVIKYDNFFHTQLLEDFIKKWSEKLGINIEITPLRTQEEIIYEILSLLPEWLVYPKLYFDSEDNLILVVQNDYEEKLALDKFVLDQSNKYRIPIILEVNLSISRIKQIIYQTLDEYVEISRLKIYPEKTNIYLEGILKSDQDEELLEDEIHRIETKTMYSIESYIKRRSIATSRKSVHDILQELLNTYQILPFTEEHYNEADKIEWFDSALHGENRIDLRDLDCFSVDPTGTKAVDDCISVQRITNQEKEDELLLGIHVVDITSFVEKDSLLDKEAKRRGFTVYLNHEKQTYSLFPDKLIEKVSFAEKEERPALSLFIRVSLDATIEEFFLKKTIIINKKQFTYSEVNEILIEQKGEFLTDLQLLVSLTSQFKSSRIQRGSINLDFMPDNIADQIISELMILANRLVGFHLQSQPGQKIFRNQHIQSYTYLLLQKNFSVLGYNLDVLNKNPLTDINRLLQEAAINGEAEMIMSELRNYLSNAYYSHTCTGHETLGTKWYTQWTSPLRKYMDVIAHRIINREYIEDLQQSCQYNSAVERLLKIKLDSTNKTYYVDLIDKFIVEKKHISATIFKKTYKSVILSTDQDFFLSILTTSNMNNKLYNNDQETILNIFKDNLNLKIIFTKITRDKKDLIVYFDLCEINDKLGDITSFKAKLLFFDE